MKVLLLMPIILLQGCFYCGKIIPIETGGYKWYSIGLGSAKTPDLGEVKSELINLEGLMVKGT